MSRLPMDWEERRESRGSVFGYLGRMVFAAVILAVVFMWLDSEGYLSNLSWPSQEGAPTSESLGTCDSPWMMSRLKELTINSQNGPVKILDVGDAKLLLEAAKAHPENILFLQAMLAATPNMQGGELVCVGTAYTSIGQHFIVWKVKWIDKEKAKVYYQAMILQ